MPQSLSFDLHALTARLDRAADRILRAEHAVSFRRFLALWYVGELGASTQRGLAAAMGVSEPSVSRMTAVLAQTGLLKARADPGGGNRRQLSLTPAGKQLVAQCHDLLEERFAELVARSGVSYVEYARHTKLLTTALEAAEQEADR